MTTSVVAIDPNPDEPMAQARDKAYKQAAIRALDDPRQVARAGRIVREALRRNRLNLADILGADAAEAAR